jgi:hypothetical protein
MLNRLFLVFKLSNEVGLRCANNIIIVLRCHKYLIKLYYIVH